MTTNSWQRGTDSPFPFSNAGTLRHNDEQLIVGAYSHVLSYYEQSNEWFVNAPLNQGPPRLEGAAFASDGYKAWLMGGIESGGAYSRSTWEYVADTNRWVQRAGLPQPLAYGSAAFVANLPASSAVTAQVGPASAAPGPGLLWFGGRTSAGTAVGATYGYEPKLGTEKTLYTGSGRTLIYVDSRGLTTTLRSTINSVSSTTILEFTALRTPSNPLPTGLSSSGHSFEIAALTYPTGTVQSGFQFDDALTATIYYNDADVLGVDENELALLYWNGSQWVDAATTCAPSSTYTRYPDENRVALPVCRVGEFALAAERTVFSVFLPAIYKR